MKAEIEIVADAQQLAQTAADLFVEVARDAISLNGLFSVALAGGSTPKSLYALLASEEQPYRSQLPWNRMHFFWGDERHVSPEHSESNYRMAYEAMLAKVPVPFENVHRIKSENQDASQAANDYERTLREFFSEAEEDLPRFDSALLGMGSDGHVASIFPGSEVINEKQRLVAAPFVKQLNSYRITLTLPVLNNSACVLFMVSGANKAEALQDVLQNGSRPEQLPAQLIKPTNGRLLWLVDEAAACLLPRDGTDLKEKQ